MPTPGLLASHRMLIWTLVGAAALFSAIGLTGIVATRAADATQGRLDTQSYRLDAQQARLDAQRYALHAVCVGVRNENILITQSFERSLRNLPRITYYRTHRADLRAQLREIRHQLRVFRPRTCK